MRRTNLLVRLLAQADCCLHHQIAHFAGLGQQQIASLTHHQPGARLVFGNQGSRADGRQTARLLLDTQYLTSGVDIATLPN